MRSYWSLIWIMHWLWLGWWVDARAQPLPTVDEAINLSQKTGRPIFALAGNKT